MAFSQSDPVVSPEWLFTHLGDNNLVIVDCRFRLGDAEYGKAEYQQGHLPGAFYLSLDHDLSSAPETLGGRHPLPKPEAFEQTMRSIGVSSDTKVISYDQDGSGAARLWWLLQYFGHTPSYVLDQGLSGWSRRGFELTSVAPRRPEPGNFVARPDAAMVVTFDDVSQSLTQVELIDARAPERYRGDVEPVDAIGGHIPGAVNRPFSDMFLDSGGYQGTDALASVFGDLTQDSPIVYCGSGVTACVDLLALKKLGRRPRLYAGSWSDWISHRGVDIERG